MVILVLVSAVRLSPMDKEMGLRSLASIAVVFSGLITTGLAGSIKNSVHTISMLSVISILILTER